MDDSEIKTRVTSTPAASPRLSDQGEQCLVLIHPPGPSLGRRYVLDRTFINIGRESTNDVVLDRDSVSRRHARIALRNGERVLVDLGSTNGTYVNDRQIEEHRLRSGDQLKVGNSILKYLSGQDVEQAYHEEIYKMTIMDGLTEVYNKRYFLESLERELARAKRYGRALSLIMFDIDFFKNINDNFGHLAGDKILKDLAQMVKGRTRSEEIVARYGGEEFAVLVPETDNVGSVALAEQVRKLVEAKSFTFEGESIPVTISLGVASLTTQEWNVQEFIKASDEKLYAAKRSGRNKTCGDSQ